MISAVDEIGMTNYLFFYPDAYLYKEITLNIILKSALLYVKHLLPYLGKSQLQDHSYSNSKYTLSTLSPTHHRALYPVINVNIIILTLHITTHCEENIL